MDATVMATEGAGQSAVAQANGVVLVDADHPLRKSAEAYIKRVYRRAFAAEVHHFSAQMLVKVDPRQGIKGVVGLTLAADQRLFLEQYLNSPIEDILASVSASSGRWPSGANRQRIVEIGNLAMIDPCSVRRMISFLTEYLIEQKIDWVVFTATTELRNSFQRMGLPLTSLADAEPTRLVDSQSDWGSYYDRSPRVVAGRLADAMPMPRAAEVISPRVWARVPGHQPVGKPLLPLPGWAQPVHSP